MSEKLTFATQVIKFFRELEYNGSLPEGISIMNPFLSNPLIFPVISQFYNKFFISAVCPLGFTAVNSRGNSINFNYYDSKKITDAVKEFIIISLKKQLEFGINEEFCFCLGTGKNLKYLVQLNT